LKIYARLTRRMRLRGSGQPQTVRMKQNIEYVTELIMITSQEDMGGVYQSLGGAIPPRTNRLPARTICHKGFCTGGQKGCTSRHKKLKIKTKGQQLVISLQLVSEHWTLKATWRLMTLDFLNLESPVPPRYSKTLTLDTAQSQ